MYASRDNARTPMQWTDGKNAGFTDADAPWFELNPNFTDINVEAEINNPDSILNYYKKLLKFRKDNDIVKYGGYETVKTPTKLFAYKREYMGQKMLVICSFSEKEIVFKAPDDFDISKAELMLSNYSDNKIIRNGFITRPYETRVYLIK
jgi:glycosidase